MNMIFNEHNDNERQVNLRVYNGLSVLVQQRGLNNIRPAAQNECPVEVRLKCFYLKMD